jgi:hypothetical protein
MLKPPNDDERQRRVELTHQIYDHLEGEDCVTAIAATIMVLARILACLPAGPRQQALRDLANNIPDIAAYAARVFDDEQRSERLM